MTDHNDMLREAKKAAAAIGRLNSKDRALWDRAFKEGYAAARRDGTAPQPLFEGEVADAQEWLSSDGSLTGQVLIETTTPWRSDLGRQRVVVYAAVAGSATSTVFRSDETEAAAPSPRWDVAGSATPTCRRCGIPLPDGGEYAFDTEDRTTYHYCPDNDACDARQAVAGSATPTFCEPDEDMRRVMQAMQDEPGSETPTEQERDCE